MKEVRNSAQQKKIQKRKILICLFTNYKYYLREANLPLFGELIEVVNVIPQLFLKCLPSSVDIFKIFSTNKNEMLIQFSKGSHVQIFKIFYYNRPNFSYFFHITKDQLNVNKKRKQRYGASLYSSKEKKNNKTFNCVPCKLEKIK